MDNLLEFSASPLSRHPKNFPSAYSKVSHKYASSYIQPSEWEIRIGLDLAVKRSSLQAQADAIVLPAFLPALFEQLKKQKDKLLSEIKEIDGQLDQYAVRFKISKADGSFSRETRIDQPLVTMKVPAVGNYLITMKAKEKKTGKVTTMSQSLVLQDILIVSMGDSYAAGEGNPDKAGNPSDAMLQYGNPVVPAAKTILVNADTKNGTPNLRFATWQEPLAHRSYRSGHSKAARMVEGAYKDVSVVSTFLPYSRSGGKIDEGLIGPNTDKYHPERESFGGPLNKYKELSPIGSLDFKLKMGQIPEIKGSIGNRRIDFLVMTIGGNDVNWKNNFPLLVKKDLLSPGDEHGRRELKRLTEEALAQLPQKFRQLNFMIKEFLNPRHVLITEYPNGFFGNRNSAENTIQNAECDIFKTCIDADVTGEDARLVKDLSVKLNKAIEEAAKVHNWIWVDGITEAFKQRGYCAEDCLFVQTSESFLAQGDWFGMLHPNEKGQQIYGDKIAEKIQKILRDKILDFKPA